MKFGLLVRKECWTLSWRGRLLIFGLAIVFGMVLQWEAYPFLAVNHLVDADVLVVEGWVDEPFLNQAAAEFQLGHYRQLLLAREDYAPGAQYHYEPGPSSHEYKAGLLVQYGVPHNAIGVLTYPAFERDRTYHTALAVKKWFAEREAPVRFNIATEAAHARRSWLLFSKAFGNTAAIGIVALRSSEFDPQHWWNTSQGVRTVIGEEIAYVYAKLFFVPNS